MFINDQNYWSIGNAAFMDALCQAAAEAGYSVGWPFSPIGQLNDFFRAWCGA